MKVAASWSGGKDGCFAVYKATKSGLNVVALLAFMSSNGKSNFHRLPAKLITAQSEALDLPVMKWKTTKGAYEAEFKRALQFSKSVGCEGLLTGDIYEVAGHEEGWLERICKEVGLKPVRPLWQADTKQLLREFIDTGFKATIVKVNLKVLNETWLGRELDNQFYEDISKLKGVDPCGEGGEYHTCVTDAPNFKKQIKLTSTEKTFENDFAFLNIKQFKSIPK